MRTPVGGAVLRAGRSAASGVASARSARYGSPHTTTADDSLAKFLSHLHTATAADLNRLNGTPGRDVWFNYWDTRLTFEKSYLARLNYVHQNAVKHGLVAQANEYRWCSAAWFEGCATRAQVQTIYSFKTDRVHLEDDYAPVM